MGCRKGIVQMWIGGDSPETPTLIPYIYDNRFKKSIDVLNGQFRDLRKKGVYCPIRNSDYKAWRSKLKRGGDFTIYAELKKSTFKNRFSFL